MIREIEARDVKFKRMTRNEVVALLAEALEYRKGDARISTEIKSEIENSKFSQTLALGRLWGDKTENDYFFYIVLKNKSIFGDEIIVFLNADNEDNKLSEGKALDNYLKRRGWKNRKEFFNYGIYPLFLLEFVSNKNGQNDYNMTYIDPLNEFLEEIGNERLIIEDGVLKTAIYLILKSIKTGDIKEIRAISKAWGNYENSYSNEELLVNYVFPNESIKQYEPIKIIEAQKYFLKMGRKIQRQALQQLCNRMHIRRAGGKGGRPKSK